MVIVEGALVVAAIVPWDKVMRVLLECDMEALRPRGWRRRVSGEAGLLGTTRITTRVRVGGGERIWHATYRECHHRERRSRMRSELVK